MKTGRIKRMSKRIDSLAPKRVRKSTMNVVKDTFAKVPETRETEILEASTAEPEPIEIPILTPPGSPIHQTVPIQTEAVQQQTPLQKQPTPQQGPTSKGVSTPIQRQRSGVSFPEIPNINLGSGPTNLDDIPDMPFYDDGRTKAMEKRVAELEKYKAASDGKVKNLEAENVVLKDESRALKLEMLH
ncbi:hypothetical protein Hanom_Chr12g01136321 [Helianthus anomalus]